MKLTIRQRSQLFENDKYFCRINGIFIDKGTLHDTLLID